LESHCVGRVVFCPEDEVIIIWIEEYWEGAGPEVELAMHTGWVGPTLTVAANVPTPVDVVVVIVCARTVK